MAVSPTFERLRRLFAHSPVATSLAGAALVWTVAFTLRLYVMLAQAATTWDQGAWVWFLGRDFAVFHLGGSLARLGAWTVLYDLEGFADRFDTLTGLDLPAGGPVFRYPPPTALAFEPVSLLPLGTSLAVWTVGGLAAYLVATRLLRLPATAALLVLASIPAYSTVAQGQNTFFFLLVFAAAAALVARGRSLAAGLVLGLLVLKPQLAAGPAVWLLSSPSSHRSELTGALVSGGALGTVSAVVAPSGWKTYLSALPELADPGPVNRVWYFSSLDFWRMLAGEPRLATVAWAAVVLAVVVAAVPRFRRLRGDGELSLAIAVVVTLLVTPHLVVYDWLLAVVPGAILWHRHALRRPLLGGGAALLGLVALVGPDLATRQLEGLGVALHPAYPALLLVSALLLGVIHRRVPTDPDRGPAPVSLPSPRRTSSPPGAASHLRRLPPPSRRGTHRPDP